MYDYTDGAAQRITRRPRDGGLCGAYRATLGSVTACTGWPAERVNHAINDGNTYIHNNNDFGKVTQPDRIQPDWRNIGTKYQHDRQHDTIVFDTYNREVTLNGVGIDNNLLAIAGVWCQG